MQQIPILLLLALPASGKSEVRRYLDHLDPATLQGDMHLGPTAQLDDYPYVHLMRRISQELRLMGQDPIFFDSDDATWNDARDWLTLIHLVNDDYRALTGSGRPPEAATRLLDRFDQARALTGAPSPFGAMDTGVRYELEARLASDVAALEPIGTLAPDATIVIEFARGGPEDGELPLVGPCGYAASIGALDEEILERARILYVWVEPEESRRRNRERAVPGLVGDASILHHGVPEEVMRREYGIDDMAWLEAHSRRPGTIPIGTRDLPFAKFDNRSDRTSFLRRDVTTWPAESLAILRRDLGDALTRLAGDGA